MVRSSGQSRLRLPFRPGSSTGLAARHRLLQNRARRRYPTFRRHKPALTATVKPPPHRRQDVNPAAQSQTRAKRLSTTSAYSTNKQTVRGSHGRPLSSTRCLLGHAGVRAASAFAASLMSPRPPSFAGIGALTSLTLVPLPQNLFCQVNTQSPIAGKPQRPWWRHRYTQHVPVTRPASASCWAENRDPEWAAGQGDRRFLHRKRTKRWTQFDERVLRCSGTVRSVFTTPSTPPQSRTRTITQLDGPEKKKLQVKAFHVEPADPSTPAAFNARGYDDRPEGESDRLRNEQRVSNSFHNPQVQAILRDPEVQEVFAAIRERGGEGLAVLLATKPRLLEAFKKLSTTGLVGGVDASDLSGMEKSLGAIQGGS